MSVFSFTPKSKVIEQNKTQDEFETNNMYFKYILKTTGGVTYLQTFENVFKQFQKDLSVKKMIVRFISFKTKLKASILLILIFLFSHLGSIISEFYYLIMILCTFLMYLLINKELKKIKTKRYGSDVNFHDTKYLLLFDILEKNNIYDPKNTLSSERKIHYLISILNENLNKKKTSVKLLSILGTIFVLAAKIIPFSKITATDISQSWLTLAIQLVGLLMMTYPLIFEIMDKKHLKMDELRNMLYEILFRKI
ncbi:hypothetical protein [Cohnella sp. REN36]|uniref:hypothetical protein n=1 Tax=Cohnella sp. REN36 TaxID=2887347 RepID=UPI001D15C4BC|nr:hypothetical protein [Cohnella sp. REN36]MCC3372493.1 hypothetical protein [Cohnella sp. REN36]